MEDEMVFFEKSSRFKRVDYREVPPSGRLNNKKIKKDEVSSEENTSSDVDRINDTQKETTGKSKKGKKNEPMKKETGKSKSTGTKVDITDDSDNDDNDNNEIESLDEGEDFADLVKQFKARSGASKLHLKGVPIDEINNAKLTALQELARFKRSLEPFLTEKVLASLDQAAATRQHVKRQGSKSTAIDGEDEPDENIPPPKALAPTCILKPYQMEGLTWLVSQYNKCINSILADEMGLGKTLQSIALIAHLIHDKKLSGQHLVVVPLSVMFNWINEFKKFCPVIKVRRIHSTDPGEQQKLIKIMRDEKQTEVVITTYDTIKSGMRTAFRDINWRTVILDEGHRIKNEDSDTSQTCGALRARFKLILTGTPVQNNLHEAWVMLQYLAPQVFTSSEAFDEAFLLETKKSSVRSRTQIDRERLVQAHYLMRLFVLRRLKSEVEKKLPPKLETKINCPMTALQLACVRKLLLNEQSLLLRSANSDSQDGLKNLKSLMAQLRKAANHPFLFEGVENVAVDGRATEEIVTASGKMIVLDKLLRRLRDRGHRVVLFSQFTRTLDIICDFLELRAHPFVRLDGSTNRVLREVNVNRFNEKKSKVFIFCLSTRAGGEGINLVTADTVILFDSDWNPQVDVQAMARVHRIGQTKPVHIYRLVTTGSIEERIVQRAQKKLFLDGMVNRGSTAQGKQFDEIQQKKKQEQLQQLRKKRLPLLLDSPNKLENADEVEVENEEDAMLDTPNIDVDDDYDEEESEEIEGEAIDGTENVETPAVVDDNENDGSDFLSMMRFGWNAVFSSKVGADGTGENELTDADIDLIIDRTRGLDSTDPTLVTSSGSGNSNSSSAPAAADTAQVGGTSTVITTSTAVKVDDKYAKLVERQEQALSSFDENEAFVAISGDQLQQYGPNLKNMSFREIAAKVIKDVSADNIVTGKRQIVKRTKTVYVTGHGVLDILNSNDYDMDEGEPSVLKRELSDGLRKNNNSNAFVFMPQSRKQIPGRDFESFEHCQVCWDGGDIILCDICPNSFHLQCLGLKENPTDKVWSCPHHSCFVCKRRASQAGLLFRCEMCPEAYCEDCIPGDAKVLGPSIRYEATRYRISSTTCYINCSLTCAMNAKKEYHQEDDDEEEDGDEDVAEDTKEAIDKSTEEVEVEEVVDDSNNKRINKYDKRGQSSAQSKDDNSNQLKVGKSSSKLSSSSLNESAKETEKESSLSANVSNKVLAKEALAACTLPDVLTRLCVHPKFRFKNLKEIPLFETRLEYSPPQVKGILLEIMHLFPRENPTVLTSVDEALERIYAFDGMSVDAEVSKLPVYEFNAGIVPPLPPPTPVILSSEPTSESIEIGGSSASATGDDRPVTAEATSGVQTVLSASAPVFQPTQTSLSAQLNAQPYASRLEKTNMYADIEQKYVNVAFTKFIKIVSVLTQAKKIDLFMLAHLLGVGLTYSPMPPPKDEMKRKYYIAEPRFRFFTPEGSTSASTIKSNATLELIAAFFVNPSPLNLLWYQKELDCESSVTLNVCRHLETLVQPLKINYCGEFLTATSAKVSKPHDSIIRGEELTAKGIPKGKKFTPEQLRDILPASLRVYNELKNGFHSARDPLRRLHHRTAIQTCLIYFAPIVNAPIPSYSKPTTAIQSSNPYQKALGKSVSKTFSSDDWLLSGPVPSGNIDSDDESDIADDGGVEKDNATDSDYEGSDAGGAVAKEELIDDDNSTTLLISNNTNSSNGNNKRRKVQVDKRAQPPVVSDPTHAPRDSLLKEQDEKILRDHFGDDWSRAVPGMNMSGSSNTAGGVDQVQRDQYAHKKRKLALIMKYNKLSEHLDIFQANMTMMLSKGSELSPEERTKLTNISNVFEQGTKELKMIAQQVKSVLALITTNPNKVPQFISNTPQQFHSFHQYPQHQRDILLQQQQEVHTLELILNTQHQEISNQFEKVLDQICALMRKPFKSRSDDEKLMFHYYQEALKIIPQQSRILKHTWDQVRSPTPLPKLPLEANFTESQNQMADSLRQEYLIVHKKDAREKMGPYLKQCEILEMIKNSKIKPDFFIPESYQAVVTDSGHEKLTVIEIDTQLHTCRMLLQKLQTEYETKKEAMTKLARPDFVLKVKKDNMLPFSLQVIASRWLLKNQSGKYLTQLNSLITQREAGQQVMSSQYLTQNHSQLQIPIRQSSQPYYFPHTNASYNQSLSSGSIFPPNPMQSRYAPPTYAYVNAPATEYPPSYQQHRPIPMPYSLAALPNALPSPFPLPFTSNTSLSNPLGAANRQQPASRSLASAPRSEQMRRDYYQNKGPASDPVNESVGFKNESFNQVVPSQAPVSSSVSSSAIAPPPFSGLMVSSHQWTASSDFSNLIAAAVSATSSSYVGPSTAGNQSSRPFTDVGTTTSSTKAASIPKSATVEGQVQVNNKFEEPLEIVDLTTSEAPSIQKKTIARSNTQIKPPSPVSNPAEMTVNENLSTSSSPSYEFPYEAICSLEKVVAPLNWSIDPPNALHMLRLKALMRILNVMQVSCPNFNLREYTLQVDAAQRIELFLLQGLRTRMRQIPNRMEIAQDRSNYLTNSSFALFTDIPSLFDIDGYARS